MKKLHYFTWTLKILIALAGVALFVMWIIDGETWNKPLSYLATIAIPFAPDAVSWVFKWKPSEKLTIAYEVFLIFSMVLGIDFDLYKTFMVVDGWSYFDKIVHAASGVLTAFVGKEILDANYDGKVSSVKASSTRAAETKTKKYSSFFAFLFIVGFVALVAAAWECFEFSYDQIAGGSMQQLVSEGVADTMWDIIGALGAGVIAAVALKGK